MTVLFVGGSHCREGHAAMLRASGAIETFADMQQLPALIAEKRSLVAGFSGV